MHVQMQWSHSIFLRKNGTTIHPPQNHTYQALSCELHSADEDQCACLAVQKVNQKAKKKKLCTKYLHICIRDRTFSCWVTLSSWFVTVPRGTPVWDGSPSIAKALWVVKNAYLLKGRELFCSQEKKLRISEKVVLIVWLIG